MAGVTDSFDSEDYGRLLVASAKAQEECRLATERLEERLVAQGERAQERDEARQAEMRQLSAQMTALQEAQAADDEARAMRTAAEKRDGFWLRALGAVLLMVSGGAASLALSHMSRMDRLEVQAAALRQADSRLEAALARHEADPGHEGTRSEVSALRSDVRELGATVRGTAAVVREMQQDVRELRRRVR
ncbi:MAG: hypothetical protein VYE22_09985 [Myxococcota bacterium]|nr:hypothetical protein [Myxococcota bacterium]